MRPLDLLHVETHVGYAVLDIEVEKFVGIVQRSRGQNRNDVEIDFVFAQLLHAPHHAIERAAAITGLATAVIQESGTVDADPDLDEETRAEYLDLAVVQTPDTLRRFRDKYTGPNAPPPTSRALYAELTAVTPDSLRPLLSDLFEHITLWDTRTDSVKSEPVSGGEYRVTLFVDASKVRADSVGNQTKIDMNDLVEVGVFAGSANEGSLGESLYLKQHRIRSGKQTIEIIVPRQPARAAIDPFKKLIERDRADNVGSIAAAPPT